MNPPPVGFKFLFNRISSLGVVSGNISVGQDSGVVITLLSLTGRLKMFSGSIITLKS